MSEKFSKYPWFPQEATHDCGAAALRMILHTSNISYQEEQLRFAFSKYPGPVSIDFIQIIANQNQLKSLSAHLSIQELNTYFQGPAILHFGGDHFVVLFEIQQNQYIIGDPVTGIYALSSIEFQNLWLTENHEKGVAIFFEKDQSHSKKLNANQIHTTSKRSFYFYSALLSCVIWSGGSMFLARNIDIDKHWQVLVFICFCMSIQYYFLEKSFYLLQWRNLDIPKRNERFQFMLNENKYSKVSQDNYLEYGIILMISISTLIALEWPMTILLPCFCGFLMFLSIAFLVIDRINIPKQEFTSITHSEISNVLPELIKYHKQKRVENINFLQNSELERQVSKLQKYQQRVSFILNMVWALHFVLIVIIMYQWRGKLSHEHFPAILSLVISWQIIHFVKQVKLGTLNSLIQGQLKNGQVHKSEVSQIAQSDQTLAIGIKGNDIRYTDDQGKLIIQCELIEVPRSKWTLLYSDDQFISDLFGKFLMGELYLPEGEITYFSDHSHSIDNGFSIIRNTDPIFNDTMQFNVCLDTEGFDEQRYRECISLCDLKDTSQILSEAALGTQPHMKVKILFARFLYSENKSAYFNGILDDLSRFEAFNLLDRMKAAFTERTVLIRTRHVQLMSLFDHLIILEKGLLYYEGPPGALDDMDSDWSFTMNQSK